MVFQKGNQLGKLAKHKGLKGKDSPLYGKIPWNKGKHFEKGIFHHSEEAKRQMSKKKLGINNPMWKGNNAGYSSLHSWVKRHKEKKVCICGKTPYDVANISGKYKRDINDYNWLCRKCHMISDGRLEKLKLIKKR